ncbi:Flagellin protein flaG [gamma proteobacterium IMCC1989]|nr:Flagellin protein flaG [gamma proteobacterium IMCC1989]
MNEVRPTQVAPTVPNVGSNAVPQVASATSSTRSEDTVVLPVDGKELPVKDLQATQNTQHTQEATANPNIEQAVTEINDYVQSVQRDLHFSVDKDSGETVVRVRDKESGELIRQIPEDIFLSLAQNLKDNQPIHLFDAHG